MKLWMLFAGVGTGFVVGRIIAKQQFGVAPLPIGSKTEEIAYYNLRIAQQEQTARRWASYGALVGVAAMFIK